MAKRVHLYTRNTSRRGDNSKYIGTLKVVKGKSQREYDCDGTVKVVYHTRLPAALRHLTATDLYNGLDDHFGERCSCEHDCCGCYFGGVRDVYKSGRKVAFTTVYQRNV